MQALIIDLDNYPNHTHELLKNLEKYSQVTICYAQHDTKIPIDWLIYLARFITNNNFKIIKMTNLKKYATNFGVTFWAGALMAQSPEHAHFDIVSNDTNLDFLVELLNAEQRTAKRIGRAKEYAPPKFHNPFQEYCLHLADNPNKPIREIALLNSIRIRVRDESIGASQLLAMLVNEGVVTINDSMVSYDYQKLNEVIKK